ncbi:MAG: hypothetical protein LBN32_00295 [Helicobacteraceae bacterium]|jgi:DNA repair protein RecN (Recombination protein N)|nr:hypothetical protein [Helicobacteraceae bacterium]
MIERITLKGALSFKNAQLLPSKGLNIFSGPSGAGKSVLLGSILGVFGLAESDVALAEVALSGVKLSSDLPVEGGEFTLRQIKKDKTRFFINDFAIGKNTVKTAFVEVIRYLSHKDTTDISSKNLLSLLDMLASLENADHSKSIQQFHDHYNNYVDLLAKLNELQEREARSQELREFATFEIAKIESIAPKKGEYEKLTEMKKELSKKEKIQSILKQVELVKENEGSVYAFYDAIGADSSIFSEAMNELAAQMESAVERLEEIDNVDPEAMLERIEKLSALIRRFGGIDEALLYAERKKDELAKFESIDIDIKKTKKEIAEHEKTIGALTEKIKNARKKASKPLEETINSFLEQLYLPSVSVNIIQTELNADAGQKAAISLNGTAIEKISAGEFNRLRLALLAARVKMDRSDHATVLFLDEIDANVSGEEAYSIAKVLKFLSSRYQIFAISHQSQLTSKADAHYLVTKENGESNVRLLDRNGRIGEIARIISADQITDAALKHAEALLNEH